MGPFCKRTEDRVSSHPNPAGEFLHHGLESAIEPFHQTICLGPICLEGIGCCANLPNLEDVVDIFQLCSITFFVACKVGWLDNVLVSPFTSSAPSFVLSLLSGLRLFQPAQTLDPMTTQLQVHFPLPLKMPPPVFLVYPHGNSVSVLESSLLGSYVNVWAPTNSWWYFFLTVRTWHFSKEWLIVGDTLWNLSPRL